MIGQSESDIQNDVNFAVTLPITISYQTLENFLREKFNGEIIKKEKDSGSDVKYAEILDISLSQSDISEFDVAITLDLKLLTFIMKNREMKVKIDASLDFNKELQAISISNFEVDSQGLNLIADNLLESVVNKFMYTKLKQRLNFDLMPQLQEGLDSLNLQLANKMEAKAGIKITGNMQKLEVTSISARQEKLWIFMALDGWGVVEVEEITL